MIDQDEMIDGLPVIDIEVPTNAALLNAPTVAPMALARSEIVHLTEGRYTFYLGGFQFDERGLVAWDENAHPEDVPVLVDALIGIQDGSLWAIGDSLMAGEIRYGSLASQAEGESPKMTYATLRKIKYVCGVFPREDRIIKLGLWYYAEVASIEDRDQRLSLLVRAEVEGWTQRMLRHEVEKVRETPLIHKSVTIYPYDSASAAWTIAKRAPDSDVLRRIAAELEDIALKLDDGFKFGKEE